MYLELQLDVCKAGNPSVFRFDPGQRLFEIIPFFL